MKKRINKAFSALHSLFECLDRWTHPPIAARDFGAYVGDYWRLRVVQNMPPRAIQNHHQNPSDARKAMIRALYAPYARSV